MATKATSGVTLHDARLFRQACYIDGAWLEATGRPSIDVDNPATEDLIGSVPKLGRTETRTAIDAAANAYFPQIAGSQRRILSRCDPVRQSGKRVFARSAHAGPDDYRVE